MRFVRILMTGAVLCLLAMTGPAAYAGDIERIEPPFWWTGFKTKELQLLVHGPDIARFEPAIRHRGVTLAKVNRVENPNYLFLDLELSSRIRPGTFEIVFTAPDGITRSVPYELRARETGSAERRGFDSSDVIYLITPDRFANGDPSNETVAGYADGLNRDNDYGRHGGDLQGLIDHLDYLKDLGITSLWLNPVLENAMPKDSYHGYATTDYYKTDPRYGSNDLYRKLSEEASRRGIGLIMDQIVNHCGSKHWFVLDPPSADWINMGGNYVNTNHRRTTVQDPYAAQVDRELFESGWFVEAMPDLNQRNPFLATYLIQNSIWWIEFAGLHGIRQDTYPYSNAAFLARWSGRIMEEYPGFNIVGEEWTHNPVIMAHWLRGHENRNGYVSHLPSAMDFPLQPLIIAGFKEPEGWNSGLVRLYEALVNDVLYPDPLRMVTIADNHDMDRVHFQMGRDPALTRMAVVYLLTMRGTPQLYYGTEILMANRKPGDHGDIREDFPGGWPGDEVNGFTGEGLTPEQADMQTFVRTLLNWRKEASVIHKGRLKHFAPENGTYVYFRYDDEALVMVAFNKNEASVTLPTERFAEILKGRALARDVITGEAVSIGDSVTLPARAPLILEFEKGS